MDNPPRNVVPATPALAAELAGNLRPEHRREIADTSGLAPADAVHLSLAASAEAHALLLPSGEVVFMMGTEPASPLTGSALIWMVGTPLVDSRARAVLRTARWGLGRAFAVTGAKRLEQYIPAWYRVGVRFALRLGFEAVPDAARHRGGGALTHVILRRPGIATARLCW